MIYSGETEETRKNARGRCMCGPCVRRIKMVLCMMAQLTRHEGRRRRRRRRRQRGGRGFWSGGVSSVLNVIKRNLISDSERS